MGYAPSHTVSDCNDAGKNGVTFFVGGTAKNRPTTDGSWYYIQCYMYDAITMTQIAYKTNIPNQWIRVCTNGVWTDWDRVTLNTDLNWKYLTVKNLSTTEQDISVPTSVREILLFAGAPNPNDVNQVYGGKSYIIPNVDAHRNIIYEKEIYDAGGTAKAIGFYAFYNQNNLKVKLASGNIRLRIYYK